MAFSLNFAQTEINKNRLKIKFFDKKKNLNKLR